MPQLKRVLLYYVPRPPIMAYLEKAFAKRGVTCLCASAHANNWVDRRVFHYVNKWAHNFRILPKQKNFFESHPLTQKNYRETILKEQFLSFQPDMSFMLRGLFGIQRPMIDLMKTRSRLFGWWIEGDDRLDEALGQAPDYEQFFFMNSRLQHEASQRGLTNTGFLHHAVDPEAFYPMDGVNKDIDISFVGSWSAARQKAVEAMAEVTDNLVIYGRHWHKRLSGNARLQRKVAGVYIGGDDLVHLYNRSKLVFNYTAWGDELTRTGFTMRTLEVPACKTVLLTDYSADIENILVPGEHLMMYENLSEAADMAADLLSSPAKMAHIAQAGFEEVKNKFTYDDMADRLITAFECGE